MGMLGSVGMGGWGGKVRWYDGTAWGKLVRCPVGTIHSEGVADGCGERFAKCVCNYGMLVGEVFGVYTR